VARRSCDQQRTVWRVRGEDGALDDHACACGDHVELVLEAGRVAEAVEQAG
jgi:hypothetical protein